MPPTAVRPTVWGTHGCTPCPGPLWLNLSPIPYSLQVLLIGHLWECLPLGPSGSKRGLGQWAFLPWMTHTRRNRAQPEVSGKGVAPAWLRLRAEAGGKCLE